MKNSCLHRGAQHIGWGDIEDRVVWIRIDVEMGKKKKKGPVARARERAERVSGLMFSPMLLDNKAVGNV